MHIKSLILAAAAALSISSAAYAQSAFSVDGGGFTSELDMYENCQGCAMPVQAVERAQEAQRIRDTPAPTTSEGGSDTYVPPVDPVDPVEPTEPSDPSIGIHPDHPNGGGTLVDLNLASFVLPPSTYKQIFAPASEAYNFPGGVIDAVVYPDGTAYVWVISIGL